jgi:hypothetical protein
MESMKIEIADMIDEIINSQQAFKPSSKLESGLKSYYKDSEEKLESSSLIEDEIVKQIDSPKSFNDFFDSLTFKEVKGATEYWDGIKVKTDLDYFKRWVFAFASIHTTFQNNVKGYEMLVNDMSWTISKERLLEMLEGSSLGLTNMRYKALWDFARKFRSNPKKFYKKRNETWVELRDRLCKTLYGIGQAKVSFALNLSFPVEAKVCCLDVHLLRFLGWTKKQVPSLKKYKEMEQKWLDKCDEYNLGYGVVREMYWNKVQKKSDSRYWSHCLEN